MASTLGSCSGAASSPVLRLQTIFGPDPEISHQYAPNVSALLEKKHVPGEATVCVRDINYMGKSNYVKKPKYVRSVILESD